MGEGLSSAINSSVHVGTRRGKKTQRGAEITKKTGERALGSSLQKSSLHNDEKKKANLGRQRGEQRRKKTPFFICKKGKIKTKKREPREGNLCREYIV